MVHLHGGSSYAASCLYKTLNKKENNKIELKTRDQLLNENDKLRSEIETLKKEISIIKKDNS